MKELMFWTWTVVAILVGWKLNDLIQTAWNWVKVRLQLPYRILSVR